jgi:hypothetical protein
VVIGKQDAHVGRRGHGFKREWVIGAGVWPR